MVRVRFAPSPTGSLHIGGARTALFNWFFARHHGGHFVLRIEDTDRARLVEGAEQGFLEAFRWLGMDWNEGPDVGGPYAPYRQSERADRHHALLQSLLQEGKAYFCYCSTEELQAMREEARAQGKPSRYTGRCRHLTMEQRRALETEGRRPVIRLRVPADGETVVEDLIRGRVAFANDTLDDFVLAKSDGMATYNFAVVADDSDMAITHVIRADEHLANTPKQILVYEALGRSLPRFAHIPMILAPDRAKLSKRHGATGVEEFRAEGILPQALVNYLTLLGWSPGEDRERITPEESIGLFDLGRVSQGAAVYDKKKLLWMNGQYLRSLPIGELVEWARPFLEEAGYPLEATSATYLEKAVALVRERVQTLREVAEAADYFYQAPAAYEEKGARKHFADPATSDRLLALQTGLRDLQHWDQGNLEETYNRVAEELGCSRAPLIHATRLAVTGRTMGPGLFEILELLGREPVLERLAIARTWIDRHAGLNPLP